jgi:glycerol kinase
MREGMVLYDQGGGEIWACPNVDSRAAAEAEGLIREGAAAKIYAEAGDWVSITAPARLRWLGRHRPDILRDTARLGMLSDWIVYRLTGQHVTEPSCGSSSGMFTLASRSWRREEAMAIDHGYFQGPATGLERVSTAALIYVTIKSFQPFPVFPDSLAPLTAAIWFVIGLGVLGALWWRKKDDWIARGGGERWRS